MKIGSNRNINNKAVAYHKKSTKSELSVTLLEVHAPFKMHLMKSSDKRHQDYIAYRRPKRIC